MPEAAGAAWADACRAATLFAADPAGFGGVRLRAAAGPVRDAWLARLRAALPAGMALRRVPLHAGDERLLGGLDLAATLDAGRPVLQRGLLADCDGGVLLLAMAERVAPATAARLAQALDTGVVNVARDGAQAEQPARFGMVALDEGQGEDEALSTALADRLAFWIDLTAVSLREVAATDVDPVVAAPAAPVSAAHEAQVDADTVAALCAAAQALGIVSLRAPLWAARVAGHIAGRHGRAQASAEDAALAARLVLAPRAVAWPAEAQGEPPPPESPPEPPDVPDDATSDASTDAKEQPQPEDLEELVLEAVAAALPAGLLERLATGAPAPARHGAHGAGARQTSPLRGTPAGVRRGDPRSGARLSVIETLRAAAPWQRLRGGPAAGGPVRLQVRADDFRVQRHTSRSTRTIVFAVDASGSAALHRLGEAKGAVELLLADCYVRRDRVAVIAFRGRSAELVLPPTRSLARARRDLAGVPGGGGTPLAAALDAALTLALGLRRGGDMPLLVLLTDGRANVARDGTGGRARAEAESLEGAARLNRARIESLLLDIAPQPQATALALAARMGARYVPLPHAGAQALSAAVRAQVAEVPAAA